MEISNQPELTEAVPRDILPLIQRSGVLSDRQFEEVSAKVASGEYPTEARALAERLVAARILTKFQLDRLLENKTHGLVVGHYVILDRVGAGDRGASSRPSIGSWTAWRPSKSLRPRSRRAPLRSPGSIERCG